MNDDEDDYEYLFDILYTVIFVFFVLGIAAIVLGLVSLL
jgi:hypothetical protein